MSFCEEMQSQAAGIAALPMYDAERRTAFEHGTRCVACSRALREGEQLMSLLAMAPPLPSPSAEALDRAAAPILAELGAELEQVQAAAPQRKWWSLVLPLAVVAAAALLWTTLRWPMLDERGVLQAIIPGAMALAGVAAFRRMGKWALFGAVGASALASLFTGPGSVGAGTGWICLGLELAISAIPVGAAFALVKKRGIVGSPGYFMMAAAAGALAGQAVLELRCPASTLFHVLAFHTGGVLIAIGLGALVARLPRLLESRLNV